MSQRTVATVVGRTIAGHPICIGQRWYPHGDATQWFEIAGVRRNGREWLTVDEGGRHGIASLDSFMGRVVKEPNEWNSGDVFLYVSETAGPIDARDVNEWGGPEAGDAARIHTTCVLNFEDRRQLFLHVRACLAVLEMGSDCPEVFLDAEVTVSGLTTSRWLKSKEEKP